MPRLEMRDALGGFVIVIALVTVASAHHTIGAVYDTMHRIDVPPLLSSVSV
jgi:hypothetical protein